MRGILAKKIGMTQFFSTKGEVIPVTILKVKENIVLQKKNEENDGYNAIQLGFEDKPERLCNNCEKAIAKKAKTTPKRFIKEIRDFELDVQVGDIIRPSDLFNAGDILDVTGITKGKGFQGAIKRHNQSRGPMSHGSRYHRRPGSMGAIAANRVFKGKKLPGHMGCKKVTAQNLELIKIDLDNDVVLVKGNVPGTNKSVLLVKNNIKNKKSKEKKELIDFKNKNTTAKEEK